MTHKVELPPQNEEEQEVLEEHSRQLENRAVVDEILRGLPPELVTRADLASYLASLDERVSTAVYAQKEKREIVQDIIGEELARRSEELTDPSQHIGKAERRAETPEEIALQEQAMHAQYEQEQEQKEEIERFERAQTKELEQFSEEYIDTVNQEARTPEARIAARRYQDKQDQERRAIRKKLIENKRQEELGLAREVVGMRNGEDDEWTRRRLEIERYRREKEQAMRPILSRKKRESMTRDFPLEPAEYVERVKHLRTKNTPGEEAVQEKAQELEQRLGGKEEVVDTKTTQEVVSREDWEALSEKIRKGGTIMYQDSPYTVLGFKEGRFHLQDENGDTLKRPRHELVDDLMNNKAVWKEPFSEDYLERKQYAQGVLQEINSHFTTGREDALILYTGVNLKPVEVQSYFINEEQGRFMYELETDGSTREYSEAELRRLIESGTLIQEEHINEERRLKAISTEHITEAYSTLQENPTSIDSETLEEYIQNKRDVAHEYDHVPDDLLSDQARERRVQLHREARELGLYANDYESRVKPYEHSFRLELLDDQTKQEFLLAEKHSEEARETLSAVVEQYTVSDNPIHREQVRDMRRNIKSLERYNEDIAGFVSSVEGFEKRDKLQKQAYRELMHKHKLTEIPQILHAVGSIAFNQMMKQYNRYGAWQDSTMMKIDNATNGPVSKYFKTPARFGFKLTSGLPGYAVMTAAALASGLAISSWASWKFFKSANEQGDKTVAKIDKLFGGASPK